MTPGIFTSVFAGILIVLSDLKAFHAQYNNMVMLMYSACLFCHRRLGTNDSIDRFPVGRRVAFDPSNGRLWVVCAACGRWNLTPLEERWEAIEDCERQFRQTRLRVASERIGLANLPGGLELIRVGAFRGSELAIWRYGIAFGYRRRRFDRIMRATRVARMIASGAVILPVAAFVGGSMAGHVAAALGLGAVGGALEGGALVVGARRVAVRVRGSHGIVGVRHRDMCRAELVLAGHDESFAEPSDDMTGTEPGWTLRVHHAKGSEVIRGAMARRAAAALLAEMNWPGAPKKEVQAATQLLEAVGTPNDYVIETAAMLTRVPSPGRRSGGSSGDDAVLPSTEMSAWVLPAWAPPSAWGRLSATQLLALEMAVTEHAERQALLGELRGLEDAWREAEEIAAIADNLLLPEGIDAAFRRYRDDG